jgi:hypothetical protein
LVVVVPIDIVCPFGGPFGGFLKLENSLFEAGSVAQWWSACLACTRPWVPSLLSQKKQQQKKKKKERKTLFCTKSCHLLAVTLNNVLKVTKILIVSTLCVRTGM